MCGYSRWTTASIYGYQRVSDDEAHRCAKLTHAHAWAERHLDTESLAFSEGSQVWNLMGHAQRELLHKRPEARALLHKLDSDVML